ncbi:hypothetical protein AQUCO_06400005v1 [Aquilegia coerulea]|uniref:60S ribosomal export protein NMD3 n=1 Tax=Aquilegia coerulea TaxID=218851 RepID=A0A2G5CCF5_AQUCA|nr:hypothetical protein AQUCO_06400005v1 [Aquilegia coerulea]
MCVRCLRSEVYITEGLQKKSKELLTFCVKRLRLTTAHAEFVWTKPHSKRIKVKLLVRKEVLNGVTLEQPYIVEYVQTDHECDFSCSRVQANPDQWVAAVQLRQHVSHRRTFFYLEQLILKHDAAVRAIKIKQMHEVVPIKSRNHKQLVSHDSKNNNYNYKYTFSVEICPICLSLGNLGPLVLCSKVSNNIGLLDPFTLRHAFIDADQYWRAPYGALLSSKQLVEYIVLDVESLSSEVNVAGSKYSLADVQVARASDFGKNDTIFTMRTHLGHLLNPGDYALGYDLYGANNNDIVLDKYKSLVLPDAILVKKSYEEKRQKTRGKPRPWKLKSLNMEVDDSCKKHNEEKINADYKRFKEDLEENPELTFNINLYRDKEYQPSEMASVSDGEDVPSVPLEQLLDELDINDEEDDDDEDEENMTE